MSPFYVGVLIGVAIGLSIGVSGTWFVLGWYLRPILESPLRRTRELLNKYAPPPRSS